jgi:cell division protein FtsX
LILRENMQIRIKLFTATNAHVLMVSFLLGGTGALLIGIQQSLLTVEQAIRPELKVAVFIQPNITDQDAAQWARALPSKDPDIDSVNFVSQAEALQNAQGNPALVKSLLLLRENPFPASVTLQFNDRAWLERPEPALALRAMPQVQEIRWDPEVRSVFRSLRQWRVWLARLTVFALLMLFIWCFFGLYRFLVMKAPFAQLLIQLGIGLIGGSLAVTTWGLALRAIGNDAALYKPEAVSFWPLAAAIMTALATFGWQVTDEH